jgi:hypothetical protein
MKKTLLGSLLFVTTSLAGQTPYSPQPPGSPSQGPINRYQVVPVTTENLGVAEHVFVVLDTVTGRVWKYQAAWPSKDENGNDKVIPLMMVPIPYLASPPLPSK